MTGVSRPEQSARGIFLGFAQGNSFLTAEIEGIAAVDARLLVTVL